MTAVGGRAGGRRSGSAGAAVRSVLEALTRRSFLKPVAAAWVSGAAETEDLGGLPLLVILMGAPRGWLAWARLAGRWPVAARRCGMNLRRVSGAGIDLRGSMTFAAGAGFFLGEDESEEDGGAILGEWLLLKRGGGLRKLDGLHRRVAISSDTRGTTSPHDRKEVSESSNAKRIVLPSKTEYGCHT